MKAAEIKGYLEEKYAFLSGAIDKKGYLIITFPSSASIEKITGEELKKLIIYLASINSSNGEPRFTFIVDMRQRTWENCKHIFKVLQEQFPYKIEHVYIVKPDGFWDKHKISLGMSKYTFEHSVESVESLSHAIDRNQLTPDLNGTFQYNHIRWLDFRLRLESFVYNSKETLHAYELLYNELQQADLSNNVGRAQDAIETHMTVFKDQLSRINIDPLINDGQYLLNMLRGSNDTENPSIKSPQQRTYPLDYFDEARKISLVMDNLRSAKERCFQLWHQKKNRLEQTLQLRLFEQDCDRLCAWIENSRSILGPKYTEIGSSCSEAMQLLAEHEQFAKVCLGNETVIRRTQNVGDRLISSGHGATSAIKTQMNRLNDEWQHLTRLLDNRTHILTASLQFHQKADEYLVQVPTWKHLCSLTDDLTTIESMEHLERLLQQHFHLSENISRIYAQICNDGKAIIDSVAPSQQTTNEYQFDFRAGAKHILEIVQEILVNHRYLDAKWNQRKVYLQQRLSFVAFANDVQQILDWIEKHGDAFLQKNLAVGIGKSLRQAKKLDKMHADFEMAIKNTKTNAENLIAAADNMYNEQIQQQKQAQLNKTSNSDEETTEKQLNQGRTKIYQLAHDLERRMREFDERVARRRYVLDVNLNFHTHCEEYSDWLAQVELVWSSTGGDDDDNDTIAANCEEMLEALIEQHEGAMEACTTIEQEGQILLDYLTEVQSMITPNDQTPSPQFTNLMSLIESIRKKTNDLETIWGKRRLRVELFAQIKHFEIHSREVSHLLDIWSHELIKMQQQQQQQSPQQQSNNSVSAMVIPPALPLALQTLINGGTSNARHRAHHSNDRTTGKVDDWAHVQEHIHTRVAQVVQRGRDLLSLMEKSQGLKINLEQKSSSVALNESTNSANPPPTQSSIPTPEQIRTLLLAMNDREQKLSELATQQQKFLLWRVQFTRLEREWNDIKIMINNFEAKLASNLTLAVSLTDAEKFHRDHEDIKPFVDRICERIDTLQRKTEKLSTVIASADPPAGPTELMNTLVSARQKVQLQFEDRLRLINAQIIFYKSSEQVSQMLDTLEREYRAIEDIHEKLKIYTDDEIQKILLDRLEQLDENKHSFLRACTVARQKSDLFHKYALRNAANVLKPEAYLKPLEQKIKNVSTILKTKEDTVLNAWHYRKKIIDEYLQYNSFKRNTDKVFVWIDEHDECFVSKLGELDVHDEGYMDFVRALKEKKTMVRKLVERADVLVERSHSFAPLIKDTCNRLDSGFNDFFQKIMRINHKEEIDKESGRKSDSSLEEKLEQQELNEGKRKAAKQRELIFNELLNTERAYVESLGKCLQYYLGEMRQHPEDVPESLKNKESILFLNIEEIHNFHKNLFIKDLERYADSPEDVGHCFVTWAKQFHIYYVEYCKNNESCIKLLTQYRGPYFETIQHKYQIDTLNSYLIKPVQRITKYELLLQRLMSCCEESKGEVKEGYDLMCSVPKKANDAMHLSYLEELESGLTKDALGDVLLQNSFQIWDSKQIIKKGKERHVFLFETSIVIAKILKPVTRGTVRYIYKYKLMTAEIFDVKEHLEAGEPCKFALYTGRPMSSHTADLRVTLKANDLSTKQQWVIRIRELIQENDLYHDLTMHETTNKQTIGQNKSSPMINTIPADRRSQEIADNASDEFEHISRGGSLSSMTTGSFSSTGQQQDSNVTTVLDDYTARSSQELTVSKGQHVRVVQRQLPNAPDWCHIRLLNDHHQQQQSNPPSLATSSTTITSGSLDLSSPPPSKYIEGLVPAAILKATKSSASNLHPPPPPLTLPISTSTKNDPDGALNNTDDSQHRQSSATHFSKRKASFRRILKNPVRRLSLKDSNSNKDGKTPTSRDLISTSTDSGDVQSNSNTNRKHPISISAAPTSKTKAFTFPNSDLTSFPDDTSSNKKLIDGNGGMNGIFKMTDSSASSSSATTMISPSGTLVGDDLDNAIIEVPPPMDIQAQPKLSADANVDKVTTDDSSSLAPISIVAGLSANDFQIPAALSVTTPSVNDASTTTSSMPSSSIPAPYSSTTPPPTSSSLSSSPSTTTTSNANTLLSSSSATVIPNDNLTEQLTDENLAQENETNLDQSSILTTNDEPVDDRTKYGEKRRHNIIELIETEKEYVKDLALIVEGYLNVIENDKDIKKPTGLVGLERVVFGNVPRIFEFHRDTFLPQLEQCIENPDILGRLFTTNRFNPYVRYCENKPRSEYIVSEYHDYFEEIRKKLGQKLLVSDLLIKPVQRIMRYQLLLKEILKSTERMGDESRAIRSALQVMIEVPRQANDMMNVGRIKDLPTNVHQLGELKLQDLLLVSEPISKETKDAKEAEKKLKERRVFLFQQAMVFCEEIPAKDKYSSPNYIYKYDLKINKLQHKEFKRQKDLSQFTLVESDAGNTRRVICQCKDDEQFESWVTNVDKVLQRQMDLIIALTNPTAALQREQDSSPSLFSPTFLTSSSSRNQIKKSMSDRSGKSPESFSPTHLTSTSPKSPNLTTSSSRTLSTSENSAPNESATKKSSFHLFDSILQRSVTKPLTINTSAPQQKISTPSSSSSSSLIANNNQLPEQARCLHSYNAIKEDEICVHKGEMVQIVAANQDNRWFVHRDANRTSPAAEGWIPGSVLGLKNPNSSIHHKLSPSPPASSSSLSSLHHQPTSSLSANSLHRLTTTGTTSASIHHPTITYESTLPPKPQPSTCDKRLSGVLRHCGPELNLSNHDQEVFLGQVLIIQGHVIGNPRPAIVWQHPRGQTLVDDGVNVRTYYHEDGTIQLQLLCISMQDAGIYECIATSSRGTVSQEIHVQVKESTDYHKLEQVRWSTRYSPSEYREVNEIARGRYSIVRQCIHMLTGDVCAIKLISKKYISHDRALHEYALISSVRHESLIRVFQLIENHSFSIIVSELISGGRLFDYLCSQSIILEQKIAQYIRQLLDGLNYLHQSKIVHLDIQPENLLINTEYDQLKLCDFGESIRLSNMRYVHRMIGNIEFAAPELIHGNTPVHYQTDIWSVGVVLYTLLSGLSPFLDETDEQTCANIINIDFTFPESQFPYVFQPAKELIERIFVREPNHRPSTSECLMNEWLDHAGEYQISTSNLNTFIERRKSQVKSLS